MLRFSLFLLYKIASLLLSPLEDSKIHPWSSSRFFTTVHPPLGSISLPPARRELHRPTNKQDCGHARYNPKKRKLLAELSANQGSYFWKNGTHYKLFKTLSSISCLFDNEQQLKIRFFIWFSILIKRKHTQNLKIVHKYL